MVDLKRFVNINIQPHETANVVTTRDTVVLFTPDGASGKVSNFSSMKEVEAYVSTLSSGNTYDIAKAYLQMYFNNGGIKAEVHEGIAYSAVTKAMITALPNDKIYVVIASTDVDNANCYTKVKSLVKSLNEDNNIYGINEKLLLVRTADYSDDTSEIKNEVKNLVVKYSTQLGAEMTMAAYLSKIDVSEADSIYDYMFTVENITAEDVTADMLSDDKYKEYSSGDLKNQTLVKSGDKIFKVITNATVSTTTINRDNPFIILFIVPP